MTSRTHRPFVKALYLVGALLVVAAVSEPILQIWPFRPGEVRWRFGAVGLMSGAVVGTLFGLAWIMAVAAVLDHRRALRAAAVACLAAAAAAAVVAGLFTLDFLQIRSTVNPQLRGALDLTVLRALTVLGLSVLTAAGLGIGGWRSSRIAGRPQADKAPRDAGLVFHAQPQGGDTQG